MMTAALATMRDVAGVTGSFVFHSDGRLVGRDIHAMFDDGALVEAAERLARLRETFAAVGDELDTAVIRFQDYKLYVKVLDGAMLCILADQAVNMPALRMAANLVSRRIGAELAREDVAEAEDASTVEGRAVAAPARSPRVAPPGMRRFRGHTVE
jgi:predicted regulator of Ras-like GTPase activity (Roadblock/LC7/MglB family)